VVVFVPVHVHGAGPTLRLAVDTWLFWVCFSPSQQVLLLTVAELYLYLQAHSGGFLGGVVMLMMPIHGQVRVDQSTVRGLLPPGPSSSEL